jgi:FkbM family methyltransferase
MNLRKLAKLLRLARRPLFLKALSRHRVAAAIEHSEVITFCAPATIIDIGANKGQFSLASRAMMPNARIHAFEPLPAAADLYASLFAGDPLTQLHRVALGDNERTASFYVTNRQDSSSLLKPGHKQQLAFGVEAESEIQVTVKPIDAVIDVDALPKPILMKIDVQGGELDVLKGVSSIGAIDYVYVELSYVDLYDTQALFDEVMTYLEGRNFRLRGIFNQCMTPQFGPTQADFLFVNDRPPRPSAQAAEAPVTR